jgi:hypothetical protein
VFFQKNIAEFMEEIESSNELDHNEYALEAVLPNCSKIGNSM